jgi:hypothetical protein
MSIVGAPDPPTLTHISPTIDIEGLARDKARFIARKKNGMTFLELEDREKWVDAVRPVWNDFGKNMPGAAELIQIIQRTT